MNEQLLKEETKQTSNTNVSDKNLEQMTKLFETWDRDLREMVISKINERISSKTDSGLTKIQAIDELINHYSGFLGGYFHNEADTTIGILKEIRQETIDIDNEKNLESKKSETRDDINNKNDEEKSDISDYIKKAIDDLSEIFRKHNNKDDNTDNNWNREKDKKKDEGINCKEYKLPEIKTCEVQIIKKTIGSNSEYNTIVTGNLCLFDRVVTQYYEKVLSKRA